eukprot:2568113-Prymnesium_polylepis.1
MVRQRSWKAARDPSSPACRSRPRVGRAREAGLAHVSYRPHLGAVMLPSLFMLAGAFDEPITQSTASDALPDAAMLPGALHQPFLARAICNSTRGLVVGWHAHSLHPTPAH